MVNSESSTTDEPATRGPISPGVREFEHTADLGMTVRADTLEELFRRAAAGMMALVRADDADDERGRDALTDVGGISPDVDETPRDVEIRTIAIDPPKKDIGTLLVRWLRELLYLQEVEGFVYGEADFERLDASGLCATVTARTEPARQIRELKGVTYHGLEVEREDDGWRARVIFDI